MKSGTHHLISKGDWLHLKDRRKPLPAALSSALHFRVKDHCNKKHLFVVCHLIMSEHRLRFSVPLVLRCGEWHQSHNGAQNNHGNFSQKEREVSFSISLKLWPEIRVPFGAARHISMLVFKKRFWSQPTLHQGNKDAKIRVFRKKQRLAFLCEV